MFHLVSLAFAFAKAWGSEATVEEGDLRNLHCLPGRIVGTLDCLALVGSQLPVQP